MIKNLQFPEAKIASAQRTTVDGQESGEVDDELRREFTKLLRKAGHAVVDGNDLSALNLAATALATPPPKMRKDEPQPTSRETSTNHEGVGSKESSTPKDERPEAVAQDTPRSSAEGSKSDAKENSSAPGDTSGDAVTAQDENSKDSAAGVEQVEGVDESSEVAAPLDPAPTEGVEITDGTTEAKTRSGNIEKRVDTGPVQTEVAHEVTPEVAAVQSSADVSSEVRVEAGENPKNEVKDPHVETASVSVAKATPSPANTAPESIESSASASGRAATAVQMAILRQAFENLKGASDSLQNQVAQPAAQPIGIGNISGAKASSSDFASKSGKALPRQLMAKVFERVENVIKEAARSRDGKTLSFKLDPQDLGKVRVDLTLKEGGLHARLSPENAQVTAYLRERAHDLQGTLRKLGLDVETVTVTVSSDGYSDLSTGAGQTGDGKDFQGDRNNMPGQGAQVPEISSGNELADVMGAPALTGTNAPLDHWVA